MRLVITPYTVAAFVLVLVGAGLAALVAHLVARWARRQLAAGGRVAAVGLVITALAAANTLVARPCAGTDAVRPLVAALTGGACAGSAWLQVGLVVAAAVGTSVAVRVAGRRGPAATPDPAAR